MASRAAVDDEHRTRDGAQGDGVTMERCAFGEVDAIAVGAEEDDTVTPTDEGAEDADDAAPLSGALKFVFRRFNAVEIAAVATALGLFEPVSCFDARPEQNQSSRRAATPSKPRFGGRGPTGT